MSADVRALLAAGIAALKSAGVDSPELDASLLLAEALGLARDRLLLDPWRVAGPEELDRYEALLARRKEREPVAYLLGQKEFFGLTLAVDQRVLVPRPETECLVEAALARIPGDGADLALLDVGTGSGAIAAALKAGRPGARVVASDLHPGPLALARANFAALGLAVETVPSDLVASFPPEAFDLVASNPPYLDPATARTLSPELAFEPAAALFAPEAGLALIRRLLAEAPRVLKPGGWILVEHGADQGPAAQEAARAAGFREIATGKDLAGRERFLEARK